MKCSLCGHEFDPESALAPCRGCPLARGCDLVRCPKCGFETPVEPKWIVRLRETRLGRRKKNDAIERTI